MKHVRLPESQAALIEFGLQDLISPHRLLFPDAPNAVKKLGKPTSTAIYTPWSVVQIVELIVFLPLNLVPWIGTPAFIIITGTRLGKLAHYRWFHLRGLSKEQKKAEANKYVWEDIWFGTIAMILELIPILSFFFLMTTTAGAAIWFAGMENERRAAFARGFEDEDVPPPYEDGDVV